MTMAVACVFISRHQMLPCEALKEKKQSRLVEEQNKAWAFLHPLCTVRNYSQTMHAHVHTDTRALSRGHHSTIVVRWLFVIRAERIRHHLPTALSGSFPLRLFIGSKSSLFNWKKHIQTATPFSKWLLHDMTLKH